MRFNYLLAVFFFFLASHGYAQETEYPPELDQPLPPHPFEILVDPPEGYVLAYKAGTYPVYIEEYIPEGEEIENWSEMFSVGYLRNVGFIESPRNFALNALAHNALQCPEQEVLLKQYPGTERNIFDTGYLCIGKKEASGPGADQVVLKEVEVSFARYVIVDGNMYHLQRAWHGSKKEYKKIKKNFDSLVETWKQDLDRFYVCEFFKLGVPCDGLDMKAKKDAKPFALFVVMADIDVTQGDEAKNRTVDVKLGKDDISTLKNAFIAAQQARLSYEEDVHFTLLIQYEQGVEPDLPKDRVALAKFIFFLRDYLVDQGVPVGQISINFTNFF